MEIEPKSKLRISETVMEILRAADLDQTNESQVRAMAAERLGMNLSGPTHLRLVRDVVDSFLLSTYDPANEPSDASPNVLHGDSEASPNVLEGPKEVVRVEPEEKSPPLEVDGDKDLFVCQLSKNRHVVIQDSKEGKKVLIREFYLNSGKLTPKSKNNKGVSLTTEQWSDLMKSFPAIQEAIMKMDSKIQTKYLRKQKDDVPSSVTASTPQGLVPIKTIRLDEKNYYCWAQYMESFLNQLKIAYVLKDRCPYITQSPGSSFEEENVRSDAAVQKWVDDDYICHHNILNSLSDHLFDLYSRKTMSARELWEELKLFCLSDFGTKRSLVKRYIEFQMIDGKSVLEQVQELNNIADSIAAAGMFVNENFHVSTIISKLPPSWKGCHMRLMCEEHLPFWMMMDSLKAEEESRTSEKRWVPSGNRVHVGRSNFVKNLGSNGTGKEMRGEPSSSALGGSHASTNHGRNGNSGARLKFTPRDKWGRKLGKDLRRS